MPTLEQQRAATAYGHVQDIGLMEQKEQKKYASIVHAMPALLRYAGLSQAMHFVASRSDPTQRILLDHFADQLSRVDQEIFSAESLLARVRVAELVDYLRLSQEALFCADWYRRLVQGILRIEAGEADATN